MDLGDIEEDVLTDSECGSSLNASQHASGSRYRTVIVRSKHIIILKDVRSGQMENTLS